MLVKNYLAEYVLLYSTGGQIWLICILCNCTGVLFGFYILPCDSLLLTCFCAVHNKIRFTHMNKEYTVKGDMNARFDKLVRDLAPLYELPYPDSEDYVSALHDKAGYLSTICQDNNLKTGDKHFSGKKTYWKRDARVYELDFCVVSLGMLPVFE